MEKDDVLLIFTLAYALDWLVGDPEWAPQATLLTAAAAKTRLVVLRSLTKFYAIPGLRVGYAVCAAGLAAALIGAWLRRSE